LKIWQKNFSVKSYAFPVGIYSIIYHIIDCDAFTREFLTSQGIDVGEKESPPPDPYMMQRNMKHRAKPTARVIDDPRRRFLEYDGMVLSFDATWNDDRYRVMYFLTDDTIAINEIHRPNDGKDPVATLLRRMRVPKDWKNLPSWHPSIYMEYGDSEIVEYFTPQDFTVGLFHSIFSNRIFVYTYI
jgi:hypothetical protein